MKHLLLTTIAAVLLVGCGKTQQSAPEPEAKPAEPPAAKVPDISIHDAAIDGNIELVKQYLDAGGDVNTTDIARRTPLHWAVREGHKEIAELLISEGADLNVNGPSKETPLVWAIDPPRPEMAELLITKGADVNAKDDIFGTPLDSANALIQFQNAFSPALSRSLKETAALLRKHGGKTGEELKAEGK